MRVASARTWRAKRRIRSFSVGAIILLILLVLFYRTSSSNITELEDFSSARNGTLGFGAIYILTEDTTTWRVEGLRKAAQLTGIQLTIPVQRHLSDENVLEHLGGEEPTTILNEIRALLNYLALLEAFLQTGYETALIVEDDVDFSVGIKSQMDEISKTILENRVSTLKSDPIEGLVEIIKNEYPYNSDWDILWLGHFGLEFTQDSEVWPYHDPYALPWDRLTSEFNNYYELQVQESKRDRTAPQQVVRGAAPMATYAFAVTRDAAQRIIEKLRREKAQRFDLTLHIDCKGLQLRCMAPVPEVFHHHQVEGGQSLGKSGNLDSTEHDLNWWRTRHKYTYNVEWSARCQAGQGGEKLGDKWQCMPGKYDPYLTTNKDQSQRVP